MLLTLIVATLITILVIIFGLVLYLISVLLDESDDGGGTSGLGIDSQDFITTPVSSPDELPSSNSDEQHNPTTGEPTSCNCTRAERALAEQGTMAASATGQPAGSEQVNETNPANQTRARTVSPSQSSLGLESTTSDSVAELERVSPEDIRSAELNSRILKASERQREAAREGLDVPETTAGLGTVASASVSPSDSTGPKDQSGGRAPEPGAWLKETPVAQKSRLTSKLGATVAKQIADDLDAREMQSGGTVLHWCKSRASLDKLVKLGVPLEATNRRKETALHVAIRRHKLQVMIGLLINGANIECRNELDETPLIAACRVRNIFAVQLLLIYEANHDAKDRLGNSARHHISVTCERNTKSLQSPSAAHLILAMLNEVGAKRCSPMRPSMIGTRSIKTISSGGGLANKSIPTPTQTPHRQPAPVSTTKSSSPRPAPSTTTSLACSEGCSQTGVYNGNSYNRWPNFKRESLYKRHMFSDILETKLAEVRKQSKSKRPAASQQQQPSRLLCIDGGGLRGVIVCQILIELQQYLKRPLVSYFDWIGGTSVGAFIACALCLKVPLMELRQICFDVKDEVFAGGRPYNSKFLERVLKRTFGTTTRFSDVKDRKLAVTTVLADREPCQLRLFRNYMSPPRMLERYGYAPDTFNNMSGHSIVSERPKCTKSGCDQTRGKPKSLPVAGTNQPIATKSTSTTSSATKQENATGKNPVSSGATIDQKLVAGKKPSSGVKTPTISNDQPKTKDTKGPTKTSNDTGQTDGKNNAVKQLAVNETKEEVVREKSKPDVGRKESTATTSTTTSDSNGTGASQQETILDENDPDPIIWQAVRASSAAPFFFKPYGPYLDGGIISNNPTLDMLNEFESYQKVRKFLRKHVKSSEISQSEMSGSFLLNTESPSKLTVVVSLGTGRGRVIGRQTMVDFGQVASGFATVFSPIELVRSIRAARDFFKKLMQQSCHTDDYILDRAQAWCSSLEIPYFRLNPPLATIFSIDDKRDEQLINALWQTKLYMKAMGDQLKELAELLDGPDTK